MQTVGVANRLGRAGSPVYQKWQEQLLKYREGKPPKYGAIWLTYYPHVMVEWYPHVLTVSTLHPIGPQKTLNMVEFFYPEEIVAFEREFVEAQQAAYMETCVEDDEIAERMDAGRRALMLRGDDESGPYQSPMEDGMQQFHEWYRTQMTELVQALWMVLGALIFATMGVCVKIASAWFSQRRTGALPRPDRHRVPVGCWRAAAASRSPRATPACTPGAA